jgi:hypothetical protein
MLWGTAADIIVAIKLQPLTIRAAAQTAMLGVEANQENRSTSRHEVLRLSQPQHQQHEFVMVESHPNSESSFPDWSVQLISLPQIISPYRSQK